VNAGLILIDDPIGKRDEAESQLQRDKVWSWFTDDILARCVPTTAVDARAPPAPMSHTPVFAMTSSGPAQPRT